MLCRSNTKNLKKSGNASERNCSTWLRAKNGACYLLQNSSVIISEQVDYNVALLGTFLKEETG